MIKFVNLDDICYHKIVLYSYKTINVRNMLHIVFIESKSRINNSSCLWVFIIFIFHIYILSKTNEFMNLVYCLLVIFIFKQRMME